MCWAFACLSHRLYIFFWEGLCQSVHIWSYCELIFVSRLKQRWFLRRQEFFQIKLVLYRSMPYDSLKTLLIVKQQLRLKLLLHQIAFLSLDYVNSGKNNSRRYVAYSALAYASEVFDYVLTVYSSWTGKSFLHCS